MKQSDKLKIYENFLHKIHTYQIAMNDNKIREALSIIHGWSYIHTCCNGATSEKDRKKLILSQIERMGLF